MWAFLLVRLLIAWGVNILALIVVDWMFDSVFIERWGSLLLGAAVLAIGNAFIKPILAILTLPLIIFTLGLAYFAINVAMLALAEWVAPEFSIDGFWTYVWRDDCRVVRELRRRPRPRLPRGLRQATGRPVV